MPAFLFYKSEVIMKNIFLKTFSILALVLLPAILFAQKKDGPTKFALVIGNANYTGLSPLANPVNDANDISAVLTHLGFTVDKVLNGNLEQMENAVLRLKDRLTKAENAYGFFFYAGHGVQSAGENFLIPVNANIPSENALRNRAMSVQMLLDDLNDAGNKLNVVVLDACRDNPFGWSRSGSRGLSIVSRQPADSIIVHATSAGQVASDGTGRNGLFTSQLLNNLATPGIEVKEIFNRTGQDVARVSNNQQIPAIYSQFFGTAFLGDIPADFQGYTVGQGTTVIIGGRNRDPAKFWSIGASIGSSFERPWIIGTLHGTLAPLKNSFIEVGFDYGAMSAESDVEYFSLYPFVHLTFFKPFAEKLGAYAGIGGGFMYNSYKFNVEGPLVESFMLAAATADVYLFNMIDISYTLRTNFTGFSHKISAGYVYRF